MKQNSIKSLTVTMSLLPIANTIVVAQSEKVGTPSNPNIIMLTRFKVGQMYAVVTTRKNVKE